MLNVAILGAGAMARLHAEAIDKSSRAHLVAVYASDASAQALAKDFEAQVVAQPEDIFDDPSIQAVVIATPTPTHAEYLRLAHRAQKHVLCEKPLVRTLGEADEISTLFADYPFVAAAGHVVRFTPEYAYLRKAVADEVLGRIGTIRLSRSAGFPHSDNHWLADEKECGGVVLDLMIDDLDFLIWAFGPVRSLYAQRAETRGNPRNDYTLAIARLADGALAHLEASWAETPGKFFCAYEVAGAKGILDYDSRNEPSFAFEPRKGEPAARVASPISVTPVDAQMQDFLDAVAQGRFPLCSVADGVQAARVALAVLESARSNQPVQFI